jgi:hypothetical protein
MASRNNSITAHVTNVDHNDNVLRVTDTTIRKMSVADPNIAALTVEAKAATQSEKTMTLRQAFNLYKKAMAFSVLFSTAIVMEGEISPFSCSLSSHENFLRRDPY